MSKAPATPDDSDASDQGSTQHRLLLRMPTALYEELKAAAAANRRSLNSEVLSRLEGARTDTDTILAGAMENDGAALAVLLGQLMQMAPTIAAIGTEKVMEAAKDAAAKIAKKPQR